LRERLLERAMKGDAEARFELGKNYEEGQIGLPQSYAEAEHWYREGASLGEPFAELSLGLLFHFGKGVTKDRAEAYMWYERAASHLTGGDKESVIELRDAAGSGLTPAQIAKARRLASEWRAPAPR
jgi:TPR repeat protein